MKSIRLAKGDKFSTAAVIEAVVSRPGAAGVKYDEIVKRGRILDALAKAGDSPALLLEDADHTLLATLVKGFDFATADTQLRDILIDIVEAKEPPAARAVA